MPHTVLLNNVDHKDLRVITTRGAAYGDAVMSAVTFPFEFRSIQAHYPIVFRKTDDGTSFQPVALFGLQEGQNLFLQGHTWDASYLPLAVDRMPFFIGLSGEEMVVHVDLDSPRVSATEGEAVFLPHGGTSELLARMSSVLLAIHEGVQSTPAFINDLLAHDLLEPFVFEVVLPSGSKGRLEGFYTVAEERLQALDGAALERLNKAGHLQAVFMAVASLSQLRALAERQERLDAAQA